MSPCSGSPAAKAAKIAVLVACLFVAVKDGAMLSGSTRSLRGQLLAVV